MRIGSSRIRARALQVLILAVSGLLLLGHDGPSEIRSMVRMDDGVHLNVTVWHPALPPPEDGWPAIVFVHGLGGSKAAAAARRAASRGYVGLAYTVRGQGRRLNGAPSEGYSTPVGDREARDLRAMLDWLRGNHPVNPERIGITGNSQGGLHSWMAVAHDMGIAAAVPQNFTADVSRAVTPNGGINPRAIVPKNPPLAYRPATVAARRELITAYDVDGLRSVTARQDLRERLRGTTIPVMVQFAFEDGWGVANNVIDDFRALAGPRKLYLGTGGHGSANVASEVRFRQAWTYRWFDRWLKGERNGIESEPEVEIAVLDTWQHMSLSSFPPPEVQMTTYYLEGAGQKGGRLAREDRVDRTDYLQRSSEVATVDPSRAFTSQRLEHRPGTGFGLSEFYDARGPLRGPNGILTRFRVDALRYITPKVEQDLLLIGIPEVQLAYTGTARKRQLALRLWDVDESSRTRRLISRGSMTSEIESEEGRAKRIAMGATAYRLAAGRLIEIEISNLDLDWDYRRQAWRRLWTIPVFEPGEITIQTGEWLFSLLRLPEYPVHEER